MGPRKAILGAGALAAVVLTVLAARGTEMLQLFADAPPDHVGTLTEALSSLTVCEDQASPCPHLVYLWSTGMKLSEDAMPHADEAAASLRVPVIFLDAVALNTEAGTDSPDEARLRTALVEAGATVHYPSLTLFDRTEPQSTAIVGYKSSDGYRELLAPRVSGLMAGDPARSPPPLAEPGSSLLESASSAPTPADIEILWRQTMVPPPGFFFRRAPNTRYISYDQRGKVILQHLESGEKLLGPGFIDFVPTPDGLLFVTPSHNDGLEFYIASDVFRDARAGTGENLAPIFRDREMDDQYPSVGILDHQPGVSTTYRILVSWFKGLALREYRVAWSDDGSATVTPLTPRINACGSMPLSTPILSKDGQEIAARDESTGTTKLFRYSEDGSCTELHDFGVPTSKVSFTDDGRLIAFSTPDGPSRTTTTHVYNRDTGQTTRVPESTSRGLMIPEFVGSDSLLYIVTEGVGRGAQEFRLVCCVR